MEVKKVLEARIRFEHLGHKVVLKDGAGATTEMGVSYRNGGEALLYKYDRVLTEQERRFLMGQY